jgi:hypothetical protein
MSMPASDMRDKPRQGEEGVIQNIKKKRANIIKLNLSSHSSRPEKKDTTKWLLSNIHGCQFNLTRSFRYVPLSIPEDLVRS